LAAREPAAGRLRRLLDGAPDDLAPPAPDSPPARILAAARDLCAEHGFTGLTVRAVAQQAGVNPAMINYYFGTKDRLVDALLTQQVHQLMNDVVRGLDQDAAGEHVLAEFPLRILESFRSDPQRMHLIRVAVSTEPDRFRRIIRSLGEHSVLGVSRVLRDLIADMQRAGRVAPMPPRSVLLFLMANAYGLVFMEQIAREVTGFELDDDRQWNEHRDSLGLLLRHGLLAGETPKEGAHA
jgi:AcrR family transcriptional regulator